MARNPEPEPKFAASLPVAIRTDRNGRQIVEKQIIASDQEGADAMLALEKRMNGAENVVVEGEEKGSKTWGGVGLGSMDAARGRRTKQVYRRGIGWVDVPVSTFN